VTGLRDAKLFLGGLALGIILTLAVPWVSGRINDLVPDRSSPLDYVSIVDPMAPTGVKLPEAVARLDRTTEATWQLDLLEDNRTNVDTPTLVPAAVKALASRVNVPRLDDEVLVAVATNLDAPKSLRRNGVFYLLYFSGPSRAKDWLWEDPEIFSDAATEKARTTFQAGPVVVYYAPTGAVDHSAAIRQYVGELVRCPNDSGPCPQ
jgi:hypothetical protein